MFPWIFGAPFQPINNKKLKTIISLVKSNKKQKAADLGSGNGKIVIALAKQGIEAHGYEINPFLVMYSRHKIKKAGLKGKAFVHWKSFWKTNLEKYNLIILFQFSTIMKRLERKLKKELKPKSKVISYHWKFPTWKPIKTLNKDIYLYKK